nr:MAG TPA: hypothetical protein [Caudoviricetes sp.]
MKFKVGNKVKIKENLSCKKYGAMYFTSLMRRYRGKEAKITYISPDGYACHLDIDSGNWWWTESMFEPYTSKIAKKDLRDGDKCTLKNNKKAFVIDETVETKDDILSLYDYNSKLEHNFNSNYDIVRVDRPVGYKTIYKNDEILDSTEKRYLAAVIAPFRDKVKNIAKIDKDNGKQYICICHNGGLYIENIALPYFKSGTMYVGMKSNKVYTLEELGL